VKDGTFDLSDRRVAVQRGGQQIAADPSLSHPLNVDDHDDLPARLIQRFPPFPDNGFPLA
jgi:hypothetical protein